MSQESNVELVHHYLESWKDGPDAVVAHFADGVTYRDLPFPDPFDSDTAHKRVHNFLGMVTECELRAHHVVASGPDTVISVRTDKFKINGKWLVLEVVGVATVADGKIASWMDYWDAATMQRQMSDILGQDVDLAALIN